MSTSTWNLEEELCKITDTTDIRSAMIVLDLLRNPSTDFTIRTQDDWERGGAETYVFRFWLAEAGAEESGFILKACVTFTPGQTLQSVVDKWCERRALLENWGVRVPKLIYSGHGEIIEELVPYSVWDCLKPSSDHFQLMLNSLTEYAAQLARLGFLPVNAFSDLRSHGSDVVAIDFGADLGPPDVKLARDSMLLESLLAELRFRRLSIDADKVGAMRRRYDILLRRARLHSV